MTPYLVIIACLVSTLTVVTAVPVPGSNQELDVLQIPLANGKELDVLTLGSIDQEQMIAERNKRTIGLLRELFPDITKQIDGIVNRIIAQVIRVAGPDVLRSVLAGNRNTTPRPNLAADFDDDDEDDDVNANTLGADNNSAGNSLNDENTRISIDLPTFPPETSQAEATNKVSASSLPTNSISTSTTAPITTNSTTSSSSTSTTISSTTSTTTTSTTTTSPILIISSTKSPPSSTTTDSTTTDSPIFIITPTTSTTTSPIPTTNIVNNMPDINLDIPNSLTSSMVNSLTTSVQSELNSNSASRTRAVNELQLMAIVESLNRLLNSTNYFVATRDNLNSTSQPTTTSSTTSADSTTTPKITKLLPINN